MITMLYLARYLFHRKHTNYVYYYYMCQSQDAKE